MKLIFNSNELKKFHDTNKNRYMSEVSYDLEIKTIPLISSNSTEDEIKVQYDKFKSDYRFEDGRIKTFEEAKALKAFVKAMKLKMIMSKKEEVYLNLEEAVEEYKLIKQNKLKGISAKDLLDEL